MNCAEHDVLLSLWHYVSKRTRKEHRVTLDRLGTPVAAMIRDHLTGILTVIVIRTTNAASGSINAMTQWIKRRTEVFPLPNNPTLLGLELYQQVFAIVPLQSLSMTNGFALRIF